MRGNGNGDCLALKQRLRELCHNTGHDEAIIRIVCQELEAWYLGQPEAMATAFDDESLSNLGEVPRFRDPDARPKPSRDVEKLCKGL